MLRNLWNRFIRGHKTSRQIRTLKHRPLRSGLEPLEQRRLLSITEHTLVYPLDAGPWDADSDAGEVSVAMTLKHFDVQLYDADGIKDSTVHSQDVDLYKKVSGQWVQQTEGTDYTFSYDAADDLVVLASKLSGNKYPVAEYEIFVDDSGIQDNNNNVADKTIYPTITANEAVIAVIPDSQKMTTTANDALKFNTETQFIVDNLATDNIQFVTHVGDVVNDSWTGAQWTRAVTAMNKLNDLAKTGGPNYEDGLLPYAVCPGNHDYDNATFSYQHLSASDFVRNFGAKRYAGLDWYGGASEGTVADELNHYQIFEACGYRFLHITLEREARDASLAWAQRVIETHPDLPVILSTHSYLTATPSLSTQKMSADPTCHSGDDLWKEFVKKNDQIFLVLCGHNEVGDAKLWSDTNLAGHTVYAALIDFQGLKDGDMNQFEYVYLRPDTGRIDLKYVDPDTGTKSDDQGWNMTFSTRLSFSGVAPKARLLLPVDNGPDDNDSDVDEVKVHARQASFVVQLSDVGEGIKGDTVTYGTVSVQRNGTTLTRGTDYDMSYDSAEERITLTPIGRTNFQIGSYTVTLNGGSDKIKDKGDNPLAQKSFTIVIDPAASSTILASGAPVKVLVSPRVPAADVQQIKVYGNGGNDTINLAGVTSANGFTSLAASSVYGGEGDDTITGSPFDDKIYGDAGADSLLANGGDDTIDGGTGNDSLNGQGGNDIYRFVGNDDLGQDTIAEPAGSGTDRLDFASFTPAIETLDLSSTSQQTVATGKLKLTLSSGTAIEQVVGTASADKITGNSLDNTIWGGDGADTIYGNAGHDTIYGEAGADKIYGDGTSPGPGDEDSLLGGDGADTVYGGGGNDTIYGDDVADSFTNADLLYGDWGYQNDYYASYAGSDYIAGGKGNDSIYGEQKADTILGGEGNDYILADYCGYSNDYYGGADCVVGGAGNDTVYGGYAGDTIYGDDVDNLLAGNDLLYGDWSSASGYAYGADYIVGGRGDDTVYGGYGSDRIYGDFAGVTSVEGVTYNDSLFGDDGDDTIWAGIGTDTVYAGNGNDLVYIDDSAGGDSADGGGGTDMVHYNTGDTYLNFESSTWHA